MSYQPVTPEMKGEILVALEAAIRGLECGADEDDQEAGFIAAWNALETLGRRSERIEADDSAETDATVRYPTVAGLKTTAALIACRDGLVCEGDLDQAIDAVASVHGQTMAPAHVELFYRAHRAAVAFKAAEAAGVPVPKESPHRWASVAVDDALAALGHERLYDVDEHTQAQVAERGSRGRTPTAS